MINADGPIEIALALVLGAALAVLLMPVAIRIARRNGLLDHPRAWKRHGEATPYLGGIAILLSAALAAAVLVPAETSLALAVGVAALTALGVLDDARTLHALPRIVAELAAAVLLWRADLGWQIDPEIVGLALTCAWVVVVINAINLLDLMDGVTASSLTATALAVAALALANGNEQLATALFALTGSLLGFLRFNLATPRARIFLGDGGTMPLGFLLAAAVPAACGDDGDELGLLAGCLLLAVPLLDAAVRSALRLKRRVSLLTAGHDSVANRLFDRLGSTRRVSLVIFAAQLLSGGIAVAVFQAAPGSLEIVAATMLVLGSLAAVALQAPAASGAGPAAETARSSPVIKLASSGAQRSRE